MGITTKTISIDKIVSFTLLLYLISLYAFYEIKLLIEGLYLISALIYFLSKKSNVSIYFLWSSLLVIISSLSYFWSEDLIASFQGIRALLEVLIVCNLLVFFLNKQEKIIKLYRYLVVAGLVLVIKLIFTTPIEVWGTERIGNFLYNANTMGVYLGISAIAALQLIYLKINSAKLCQLSILLFFVTIILTGSKKAIFLIVVGFILLTILNFNRLSSLIKFIPILIILLSFIYWIVMNVSFFYNILGIRIEGFLYIFTNPELIDPSTRIRLELLEVGWDLFLHRPFTGYGIASFASVSGAGYYSHNNYIELLTGIGIIGTLLYYSIYLYVILKLFKYKKSKIGNFFIVIIILLIYLEFGQVSYFSEVYHIIIATSISCIIVLKNNKKQEVSF